MSVVPNDMKHFSNLHIEDDWNEAIYGQLLNKYWNDLVTVKKFINHQIIMKTIANLEFQ